MKHTLSTLAFYILAFSAFSQSTGDFILDRKTSTGYEEITLSPNASNLIRFDGSGGLTSVAAADLSGLNASNLASGTVPTARLGSGTANSTTYLRGDGTWQTIEAGVQLDEANTWTAAQTFTAEIGIPSTYGGGSIRAAFGRTLVSSGGGATALDLGGNDASYILRVRGDASTNLLLTAVSPSYPSALGSEAMPKLVWSSASVLAIDNASTPTELHLYNTKTSATNYERGFIGFRDDVFTIGTEAGVDGGTRRELRMGAYSEIKLWNYQYGYAMVSITGLGIQTATPYYSGGNVCPDTQFNSYNLGTDSLRWSELYLKSYIEIKKQTAPANPAADRARLWLEDNGSGKMRLMAIFPTGTAQQISIEP